MRLLSVLRAAWVVLPVAHIPALLAQPVSSAVAHYRPATQRFRAEEIEASGTGLPAWTGKFTYHGGVQQYTMVGSDPAKNSDTTIIPVFIVPLKLTFSDGSVFDASGDMVKRRISATQAIVESPIFQSAPFTAGSVDLGVTQYLDAFQRANFWSSVAVNSGYHVLLGNPTVLPVQSFTVRGGSSAVSPGPVSPYSRATLDQLYIDEYITPSIFQTFPQITPDSFTIVLTYNVFPGSFYGYHDVYGNSPSTARTYAYVSYLEPYTDPVDADITTLAHEVAEWADDPYASNYTPCGLLEVADPLVSTIFEVRLNGTAWHLQDLAMVGYFYQTPAPSVNGWLTFRNTYQKPCENGL